MECYVAAMHRAAVLAHRLDEAEECIRNGLVPAPEVAEPGCDDASAKPTASKFKVKHSIQLGSVVAHMDYSLGGDGVNEK